MEARSIYAKDAFDGLKFDERNHYRPGPSVEQSVPERLLTVAAAGAE